MKIPDAKNSCQRCGTCCMKGGPALHLEDKPLLERNFLQAEHLITIRKGEPVLSLSGSDTYPARSEIVKIKGQGTEWTCMFFAEKDATCAIYENRPLECVLLKCWDTADLQKIAEKDILSRIDIIPANDPVLAFIQNHEKLCPLENLEKHLSGRENCKSQQAAIATLTTLVNTDLAVRAQAYARLRFSLAAELFYFGRPLFKILEDIGIRTAEHNGLLEITLP